MPDRNQSNKKVGFLRRLPGAIRAIDLFDGGFVLSAENRALVESEINSGKGDQSLDISTPRGTQTVSIIGQEAFVMGPHLGSGTFGDVYVVQNVLKGTWHCMKALKGATLTPIELDVLKEEGLYRASSKVSDRDLFVIELVHGKSLGSIMKANQRESDPNKKLSFEQNLELTISMMEAYESLHRKGYIHRDIKPDNIMVDLDQNKCIAIDFGLIATEQEKGIAGTPYFMSPELLETGRASIKDDIYAIGVTAAYMLSTQYQYDPESYQSEISKSDSLKQRDSYQKRRLSSDIGNQDPILFHVILGAEGVDYQEEKKLSAEEITICKILFDMTGPESERPALGTALNQMRDIRLMHIEKNKEQLIGEYREACESLWDMRESVKAKSSYALDYLDAFLLKIVDASERNRPSLEEITKYQKTLDDVLNARGEGFRKEITEFDRSRLKKTIIPEQKVLSMDVHDHTKKIAEQLFEKNQAYLEKYASGQKRLGGGFYLTADTRKKRDISTGLFYRLQDVLKQEKIEPSDLMALIKEIKESDRQAMGFFSSTKRSEVQTMLNDAMKALSALEKPVVSNRPNLH